MSIIPWDKVDPDNSPFVKLFTLIGIPFLLHDDAAAVNTTKLIKPAANGIPISVNSLTNGLLSGSTLSNSGIFSNSRMLFGLSDNKQAPPAFSKTNKNGVPLQRS
jgi:D-serine/D-alanine/glycine transporter